MLREEFSFPSPEEAEAFGELGETLYAVVKGLAAFTGMSQGDLLRPLVRIQSGVL